MNQNVKHIPTGYHTITPSLVVKDAAQAIDFYKKAFGAQETVRMDGPGGTVMHAELTIGDSRFMLGEEMPDMGARSPKGYGGSSVTFYVYCENVDTAWKKAIDAGAKPTSPLENMFWGDRTGRLEDPYGHSWMLAQHVKDVTPEEMKKGSQAFAAKMAEAHH